MRNIGLSIALACICFLGSFANVYALEPGAGGVSDTPDMMPCSPTGPIFCTDWGQAQATIAKIKSSIDFQLNYAAMLALQNMIDYAAQTVAYDTASWIANGGKGNMPLIETLTFGDYTKNLLLESAGEFIGTFSEEYAQGMIGINLCRPPRFEGMALEFAMSIPDLALSGIERPRPKCAWTDIVDNWEATVDSLDNAASLENISGTFTTGGNDFAFGIGLNTAFFDALAEKRESGILDRLENQGFKPVTSLVAGTIQTPASVVKQKFEADVLANPQAAQKDQRNNLLSNAFTVGWKQIGMNAATIFANRLVTSLVGKIMKGFFQTTGQGVSIPDFSNPYASSRIAGKQDGSISSSQFSDILTPNIASSEQKDILTELVGCPDAGRTMWNCAINASLETALRQGGGMTLRQAIERGFINEDYTLIPSTQPKDNLDPLCAQRAFCVANLRKMRLARIIPIGWEIAADSDANQALCTSGNGCVSLGEVMRNFDACGPNGDIDASHPWCHMIDPNWVLTSFPSQCVTKGFGNSFLSGSGQRMQECQDTVTCLERDASGKCVGGYGYCLAEQTFWQFDAPSCKEEYVSCRTYKPRGTSAKSIGYLRSTLDYGTCNDSNVGCMWYATKRDVSKEDDENAWTATIGGSKDKVYFDKNITRCDSQYDGCTDLRAVKREMSSLNLLKNSSFEDVDQTTKALTGWVTEGDALVADKIPVVYSAPQIDGSSVSFEGSQSYIPQLMPMMHQGVRLEAGHQYTVSLYARQFGGSSPSSGAGVNISFYRAYEDQPDVLPGSENLLTSTLFYRSSGCVASGNTANIALPGDLGTDWQRFECSFVAPESTAWGRINLSLGSGGQWLADAVQLEEGEIATGYQDGLNPLLAATYLKVPPAELGCSGDEATDHPLCAKYAKVCRSSEAGCQGYRPSKQASAPEIPAVLSNADVCPAECVGYSEFRKQPSTFDLVRNTEDSTLNDPEDETIVPFVPSTALSCSTADVGCEVFTNISGANSGGEMTRAFNYLRSCEKPDSATQTYYTWEGSEASGYQLVTWSLQKDVDAPVPQGPRLLRKAGRDGNVKNPLECTSVSYLTGADPDCRQFYDPQGNVFYAFESQTILADEACSAYRKDGSTRADCEKTGGAFTESTMQCVYFALAEKSNQCDLASAGCRAFVGTQGEAQVTVLEENFSTDTYGIEGGAGGPTLALSEESVLVGDRSLRVFPVSGSTGEIYMDVNTEPGMLYELEFWAKTANATPMKLTAYSGLTDATSASRVDVGSLTVRPVWNVFKVGPFTGVLGAYVTRVSLSGFVGNQSYIDTIRVTQVTDVAYVVKDSWKTPASCDRTPEGIPQPQAMLGCREYTDRNSKTVNVRQFTRLCRDSAIGCTAYINTMNSSDSYEQRWEKGTSTCKSDFLTYSVPMTDADMLEVPTIAATFEGIACTRDSQCLGTTASGKLIQGRCDLQVTTRDADRFEYYIAGSSNTCPSSETSCRAYGLPVFNQDRTDLGVTSTTQDFETVYLKDDVAKYDDAICSNDELFCESYSYSANGGSGTEYFRAPSNHACEYREGVVVAQYQDGVAVPTAEGCALPNPEQYTGTTYGGWFKVGADCPCYPDLLEQGKTFGTRYTGDAGYGPWSESSSADPYHAWTGVCPQTEAECTEFRDTNDLSDTLHPLGRPYFVINDERLDKESCNGQVDPSRGCVLFRDMSLPNLTYSSKATFESYKDRAYNAVSPIDCVTNPEHPSCAGMIGTCVNIELASCTQSNGTVCTNAQKRDVLAQKFLKSCSLKDSSGCNRSNSSSPWYSFAWLNETTWSVTGTCLPNDTNTVVKVKPDRSCSQWLSCATAETVYDSQTSSYKSLCSNLELCNRSTKVDQGEGVPFCTNYVDRTSSNQTILREYKVLDAETYSARPTGFGTVDYSGFSLPDRFQVMDASLEPIGSMISPEAAVAGKLKKDYRLAVGVPMGMGFASLPTDEQKTSLASTVSLQPYACFFNQSKSFGLMTDSAGVLTTNSTVTGTTCWLSLDQTQPMSLGALGSAIISDNLNVPMLTQHFAQQSDLSLDQVLSSSFPDTQCKAAPQADSPFGNAFVTEWDDTTSPPVPARAAIGYGNANFCEYGENCECVYKRVKYGNIPKFYEPLSTNVVNAICIGGSRDGLPCIVESGIEGSQQINITVNSGSGGDGESASQSSSVSLGEMASSLGEEDMRCGSGGTCTPISSTELVRGVIGQCLQYDISRPIAGDQAHTECLVWNPNPVLAGPGDQYHWSPTAGYQPPQSSGRYYCTAPIREPREQQFHPAASWPKDIPKEGFDWTEAITSVVLPLNPISNLASVADTDPNAVSSNCGGDSRCTSTFGPWPNSEGTYAGRIKNFFYADWFTSDGSCSNAWAFNGCTGNEGGASLDGHKAGGTKWGGECEDVDDENQSFVKNQNIMRLVTTGEGASRSYAEYSVLFNPAHTAYAALGFAPTDWETVFSYSLEEVIANFELTVPTGKLACAYTAPWADVSVDDYDDENAWKEGDKQWHANFTRNLSRSAGGTLNRSTARIATEDGTPGGIPVKTKCVMGSSSSDSKTAGTSIDNRGGEDGLCYMKTWQLDYRAEGQQKFQAFSADYGRNGMDHLSRRPLYGKCDSANPWFSIRAVFEDTNATENSKDPLEVSADKLVGPFQFVGFWVTACAPGGDTQYIYMDVTMHSADVCRELAETISKDSHDSAVFTDRISANSGYSMENGFSRNTANVPFGASLATGDAGKQPLFMTGVKQKDVNPLNPPTFTSPGQTYFRASAYPTSNWGLLSNVFAKIYRIYGYSSRSVTRDDYACTDTKSPEFGQWCPPVDDLMTRDELVAQKGRSLTPEEDSTTAEGVSASYCGFQGKCMKGGVDNSQAFAAKACNSFSGVNRGLDCSSDPDICHIGAMKESIDGTLTPSYASCSLFTSGYYPTEGVDVDASGQVKQTIDQKWEALSNGRYRCVGDDCGSECKWVTVAGLGEVVGGEEGCTRAMAVKEGAFRCSGGSVRDPDKVRETTIDMATTDFGTSYAGEHATYASYCTKESTNSNECPAEVLSVTCENKKVVDGLTIGTCKGYPWAQCTHNADCVFSARNYWPSGSVNDTFFWTRMGQDDIGLGQHTDKLNVEEIDSKLIGEKYFYTFDKGGTVNDDNDTWFTTYTREDGTFSLPSVGFLGSMGKSVGTQENAEAFKEAFWPAVPVGLCEDCGDSDAAVKPCEEEGSCFYATKIYNSPGAFGFQTSVPYSKWDDLPMLKLYPGFNPHIWSDMGLGEPDRDGVWSPNITYYYGESYPVSKSKTRALAAVRVIDEAAFRAEKAKCEAGKLYPCDDSEVLRRLNPTLDAAPFVSATTTGASYTTAKKRAMVANYGACEAVTLMFREVSSTSATRNTQVSGVCRGGGVTGKMCSKDTDCVSEKIPSNYTKWSNAQRAAEGWCNPVTNGQSGSPVYGKPAESAACWPAGSDIATNSPARESDPSKDSNICTHPAGYWPRPQYCADPDDEYCGLFGYNLASISSSVSDYVALPTDVTPGLSTPYYLNPGGTSGSKPKISSNVNDYSYVDYYNPIPPQIAAPDIRTCQGTQCHITKLGTFSIDGLAEGVVNGGSGSHIATIRFYAWASHEQMPLRKVYVDWGDGTTTELPDAYLKNHKPYCGGTKECSETSGLTCQTDSDCPVGGGTCIATGNCTTDPNKRCSKDSECAVGGEEGFCQARTFFGNDEGACEEQYFEFRHSYSCNDAALPIGCYGIKTRCSSDPGGAGKTCTEVGDTSCGAGDVCVSNVSTDRAGCYESSKKSCIFTPRIKVIDNWGWCTGECRSTFDANGKLVDASNAKIKHPNGGCFDASSIKSNANFSTIIGPNECAETGTVSKNQRPWIVFPGSIQILPGQQL